MSKVVPFKSPLNGSNVMAAGKGYEAVAVSIEHGKSTASFEGVVAEELKQNSNGNAQERIELVEVAGAKEGATERERPAIRKRGSLLYRVSWEWDAYDDIKRKVTAKALMNDEENPLLLAIKVIEKLHERAARKEPNEDDFVDLANRVEEFTLRFLDPLKDQQSWRQAFALNPKTDIILETAIKLEQKKFFDHPIIIGIINERWHGDRRVAFKSSMLWWLFLNIWCVFDMVLFPLSFFLAFVAGWMSARVGCLRSFFKRRLFYLGDDEVNKSTSIYKRYKDFFTLPYFIFVRDTFSYLALLGLHLAICLEPSQLAFSYVEWAILVFLFGRLLMEFKQIVYLVHSESKGKKTRALKNYFRDRWNYVDFITLLVFFCAILPLRIVAWVNSESVKNNRILEIAGYLYGFNAMLLTFRVCGSILETFEGVGTIQIALFQIIRDAVVVVLHFGAITLAFSITITKVFVVESSVGEEDRKMNFLCNGTRILCWWRIATHLGWSVLDLSDGLDFFESVDSVSVTLAQLLFAAYLVMALILLINMLIALLSNTYQRVQDNSRKEWTFQKAVTIQTYSNYHPIPVPFNILSILAIGFWSLRKRLERDDAEINREQHDSLNQVVVNLEHKYRLTYGDSFPPTYKLDKVIDDAEKTESMVNQVLYRTFTKQQGCDKAILLTGPKAWDTSRHMIVEGYLLTATNYGSARYRTAFSPRFPHFEAMVLESGVSKWLALGVVFEDYTHPLPGRAQGTVGFHTGERTIWSTDSEGTLNKTTIKGPSAARRGDVIRCTLMYEDTHEIDGNVRVPVVFTVNGSRIIPEESQTYIECNPDRPVYPLIGFYYENSVLAKMCPREDVDYLDLQMQGLKSDLSEVKSELADVHKHLISTKQNVVRHDVKSDLADAHEDLQIQEVKSELEAEFTQMKYDLSKMKSALADICEQVVQVKEGLADVCEDLTPLKAKSELSELKSELYQVKRSLEEKLNAVLAKLEKEGES